MNEECKVALAQSNAITNDEHQKSSMDNKRRAKKIIISILTGAVMLLISSCGNSKRQEQINYISEKYSVPEENQLIVYTSHKEEVYLPIIREFENRTGIWVEVHAGGTAEIYPEPLAGRQHGIPD